MAAQGAKLATGWLELTVSTAGAQKQITDAVVPQAGKAGEQAGQSLGSKLLGGIKAFAGPLAALGAGFAVGKIVKNAEDSFMSLAGSVKAFQRVAGGSIEQVSGLRGAMQLSGVDTDKAAGALTIFSKQLGTAAQDGTKTQQMTEKLGQSFLDAQGKVKPMSDILPGLADRFKALPEGPERAALATQLFGRSGTQLLPFLSKGSAGIAELTDKAKSLGLTMDDTSIKVFGEARASTREFQAATQGLSATLGQNLVPVLDGVKNIYRQALLPVITSTTSFLAEHRAQFLAVGDTLNGFAHTVGGVVSKVVAALAPMAGQLFSSLGGTFAKIMPLVGSLISSLGPLIGSFIQIASSASPLGLVLQGLQPVIPQLVGAVQTLVAALGPALGSVIKALMPVVAQLAGILGSVILQAINLIVPIIVQLANALGPILTAVMTALMPIITLLAQTLGVILAAVMPLITAVFQLIAPFLQLIPVLVQLIGPLLTPLIQLLVALLQPILALVGPLIQLLVPALTLLTQALTVVIQWIVQAITWFVQLVTGNRTAGAQFLAVWNNILSFFRTIGAFFAGMWNGLISGAVNGWNQIISFFRGIPGAIRAVFVGAGSWLLSVGGDIIAGVRRGIEGAWNNLVSWFRGLFGDLVGIAKKILGIASPSTVFAEIGANTMQGYAQGIEDTTDLVHSAVVNALAIPGATAAGATNTSSSTTGGATVVNYITTPPNEDPRILARGLGREFVTQLAGVSS